MIDDSMIDVGTSGLFAIACLEYVLQRHTVRMHTNILLLTK